MDAISTTLQERTRRALKIIEPVESAIAEMRSRLSANVTTRLTDIFVSICLHPSVHVSEEQATAMLVEMLPGCRLMTTRKDYSTAAIDNGEFHLEVTIFADE